MYTTTTTYQVQFYEKLGPRTPCPYLTQCHWKLPGPILAWKVIQNITHYYWFLQLNQLFGGCLIWWVLAGAHGLCYNGVLIPHFQPGPVHLFQFILYSFHEIKLYQLCCTTISVKYWTCTAIPRLHNTLTGVSINTTTAQRHSNGAQQLPKRHNVNHDGVQRI